MPPEFWSCLICLMSTFEVAAVKKGFLIGQNEDFCPQLKFFQSKTPFFLDFVLIYCVIFDETIYLSVFFRRVTREELPEIRMFKKNQPKTILLSLPSKSNLMQMKKSCTRRYHNDSSPSLQNLEVRKPVIASATSWRYTDLYLVNI